MKGQNEKIGRHIAACEQALVCAADAASDDELDHNNFDIQRALATTTDWIAKARGHLDAAHAALRDNTGEDGEDNDSEADHELEFDVTSRASRLAALDRVDVGRSSLPLAPVPSGAPYSDLNGLSTPIMVCADDGLRRRRHSQRNRPRLERL